ncbi:SDR family oxidoreductase [Pontixanthobacter aestiaquae]|uniref:SDR family NAD(P)-dependent oxidoreductase n=1 Tax=Pontixanthobacter aestiaquae TaxID=1509367 RepID=A0A844Z8X9_9SPHN|nr:SDR family oxidoreductase [Pontixanthobacter aestiaquae]MDN3645474.1 SDR family oxidoreductase [Pontixanthobacter aestiaquae]MXO83527.1 SDR family NAD(P)-dependent oxidoreductase [Pontixanthobacter aestiaquae]
MPNINRRALLGGAAATTVLAAAAAHAQSDVMKAGPNLQGKSILITGTSSGFGRLAAEDYARKGAKVFATMRNLPRTEATELDALAKAEDLDLHVIEIDVLDDAQVAAGVADAEKIAGGAIDVLINNAGISTAGPVEIQDMEATKLLFDTNVYGPQRLMRAVLPGMRAAKSGQIFNVTSQLGRVVIPAFGQYSPTKFALEAMSEQLAYELVPHGIDVTIIQPGGYPTEIWANANALTQKLLDRAAEKHLNGYSALVEQLRMRTNNGGSTDPMDVPNAMADIIAMPAGTRPLRKEVHPGAKPQIAINEVSAKTQVGWLGDTPYGPWIKAVHNV